MPITKIEEKESPNKGMCWLRVIVIGGKDEEEKKVFAEGERIRRVSQKLQVLGFRVMNGLPVKSNPSYYFFIVESLSSKKDRVREIIEDVVKSHGMKIF